MSNSACLLESYKRQCLFVQENSLLLAYYLFCDGGGGWGGGGCLLYIMLGLFWYIICIICGEYLGG